MNSKISQLKLSSFRNKKNEEKWTGFRDQCDTTKCTSYTPTLATWCEEKTYWKRPWHWERLKAGDRDDRGWDGWVASPTRWIWVWESSGSWWWTGKPGMLQSMGSQSRTRLSDWTELNQHMHNRSPRKREERKGHKKYLKI